MKVEERFWSKVDKQGPEPTHRPDLGPCWLWTASLRNGYGQTWDGSRVTYAHRLAYELEIGPIPDSLTLDHLCRVRRCCRPSHLEPVSNRENILRGESTSAKHARKTNCPKGHPYSTHERHGRTVRYCKTCKNERRRTGRGNAYKTHCKRGHPFDEANTIRWNGWRYCRTCSNEGRRQRRRSPPQFSRPER